MTNKTLIVAAAALGLAVSLGSAPAFAQSSDVIYVNAADDISAGKRALRRNQTDNAIRLFERGLKKDIPGRLRVVGHNDLCIAYRFAGDLKAARENCDKAIALNARYWRAYNNRANIYYDQGNYLAAQADYETALRLNPKSKLLRQNAGAIQALVISAN
ncbi:MAG: tetratricopeptide repeat protein [Proteobacteria bacterium]|nr:tetratricopeptide repeat protein [Pseudomonadota bacterium]